MREPRFGRFIGDERELRHLIDQLFLLIDRKAWDAARALFVEGEIEVDVSSLAAAKPARMTAARLLAGLSRGLHARKLTHHEVIRHEIAVRGDDATIHARCHAWNQVRGIAGGSDFWESWGAYRLSCRRTDAGWRITGLQYTSKYSRGNDDVRTHTAVAEAAD